MRSFLTVFLILIFISSSRSQVSNSVYSMFGVGQIVDNTYGINKSLGGTGIAFQSGRSINHLNPASYFGLPASSFILEIGAYGIYNTASNSSTSQTSKNINVSYFAVGLYFAQWWAFSAGIVPFSSMEYEINSKAGIEGETTIYEKSYAGSGGLNRIYFGNSFKIIDNLSIGFNASYIFGPITQSEIALSNSNFSGYEIKRERSTSTFYLDYGLQYTLPDSDWSYTMGLTYGGRKKLNTTDEYEFIYGETSAILEGDEDPAIKIPQKLGVGISFQRKANFRTGLDYQWKNWANSSFRNSNLVTKNSNRFSFGLEYSPGGPRAENWFETLFYRFGAYYLNSYLQIDKTRINSKGINIGVGIPYDANIFNLSLEYGEEGTLEKGLIKTDYWLIYLSVSLFEFWLTNPRSD